MGMPRKLKDLMLANTGLVYIGQVESFTLPKLTRKLEDWRGGGMDRPIKVDLGAEPLEAEWTLGGPMRDVLAQYGVTSATGVGLRFACAYQQDDTGAVDSVEVEIRGRHEEIDMGEQKIGEAGEFKVKTAVAYYKLVWNGVTLIEIDVLAGTLIVDGVDRRAEIRAAIGLY
ncbi:phage major tail tube protein [Sphingomonas melonis]|uniref:phage major tail tube protein n=1 Tax=Sphingomonas melonis TaxID=152682 RepID=UPI000BE24468|nr:phage major tail tube protein [Sphingomonas melonis]ATI54495.1 phage major tail tube protein [Sphingomonas melonis]